MSNIIHFSARSLSAPMLFATLPETLQDELVAQALLREFGSGQIIQQRGEEATGFWLIKDGSVAVGQFLPEGEFRAVAMLGPGDSWGELAMFARRPRVVDAVARSRCRVYHIRDNTFETTLADHPTAMRALLGALSTQLQEVLDITAGIRSGTARARVAGLLATLANGKPLPTKIRLSQNELGELLGLSRMTVNSALGHYERTGCIRRLYGGLEVLDVEKLRQAALG